MFEYLSAKYCIWLTIGNKPEVLIGETLFITIQLLPGVQETQFIL